MDNGKANARKLLSQAGLPDSKSGSDGFPLPKLKELSTLKMLVSMRKKSMR